VPAGGAEASAEVGGWEVGGGEMGDPDFKECADAAESDRPCAAIPGGGPEGGEYFPVAPGVGLWGKLGCMDCSGDPMRESS